jgi:hypothetical protein
VSGSRSSATDTEEIEAIAAFHDFRFTSGDWYEDGRLEDSSREVLIIQRMNNYFSNTKSRAKWKSKVCIEKLAIMCYENRKSRQNPKNWLGKKKKEDFMRRTWGHLWQQLTKQL